MIVFGNRKKVIIMSLSGDRIRALRLARRLTLEDVAKYLGVGRQAVYKYEQGTVTNIPLENLEKMAVLFGSSPGYLAGWISDEENQQRLDGSPSGQRPASDSLTPDESRLVSAYRALPPPGKEYLQQQLRAAQLMFGEKSAPVSSYSEVI